MTTMRTLTMAESGYLTEDRTVCNSIAEDYDPSLERIPLPLHNHNSSSAGGASQFSLSLVDASLLDRSITKPTPPLSPSPKAAATTSTIKTTTHSLLVSIPKEILTNDILGFLTDKNVKAFFDSIGEERMKSSSFSELRNHFCTLHGSKLEDSATQQQRISKKRYCPECYSEQIYWIFERSSNSKVLTQAN